MKNWILLTLLVLASSAVAKTGQAEWKWAGSKYGIVFQLRVEDGCRTGPAKVHVKLKNENPGAVRVEFRINDNNWRETVARDMPPGFEDSSVMVSPGEPSCYPFIDQVWVEDVSSGSDAPQTSEAEAAEDPDRTPSGAPGMAATDIPVSELP